MLLVSATLLVFDGKLAGANTGSRDITEPEKHVPEFQESESRFQRVVKNI